MMERGPPHDLAVAGVDDLQIFDAVVLPVGEDVAPEVESGVATPYGARTGQARRRLVLGVRGECGEDHLDIASVQNLERADQDRA